MANGIPELYYGSLARLESEDDGDVLSPDQNAVRMGVPIGLVQETHVTQRGKEYERVVVEDDAGRSFGFLPKNAAKEVIACFEQGFLCHAVPTLVVYSKKDEAYWVEVALVCYAPDRREAFDAFLKEFCKHAGAGDHPNPKLDEQQLEALASGDVPAVKMAPLPHLDKQSAVYKSKQTSAEKLANTAIEHTTGCYVALIAATVVAVAALVWFFILR